MWFPLFIGFCAVYLLNVSVFQKYTALIHPLHFFNRPGEEASLGALSQYAGLSAKNNDNCKLLKDFGSSEDVNIDPTDKYLYAVAGIAEGRQSYFPPYNLRNSSQGIPKEHVVFYDIYSGRTQSLSVSGYEKGLVAHGFDVRLDIEDPNARLLYIINHLETGSVVSVFNHTIGTDTVRHVYDVAHHLISTPNSLVTISESAFYLTNDHLFAKGYLRDFEDKYGPWRWSTVVYCSFDLEDTGELEDDVELSALVHHSFPRCHAAAHGFSYANGIAYNKQTNEIFVADTKLGQIKIFTRDGKVDKLNLKQTINLGAEPDNISFAPNNDLIITVVPEPLKFRAKVTDQSKKSPAAVIVLKVSEGYSVPHLMYWDGGETFGAATSSVYEATTENLYLSSVADQGLYVCKVKSY